MAIDPGQVRVGLALSDEDGAFAFPHKTLPAPGDMRQLAQRLLKEAATAQVARLVVGMPLTLDGRMGGAVRRAQALVDALRQAGALPVHPWDERLTTAAAERSLVESGVRRDKRKQVVDQVAATLLLQSFLAAWQSGTVPALEDA
ncbi:MAG: Holliday junction resolvase RuvX [Polyangiales bacterium]